MTYMPDPRGGGENLAVVILVATAEDVPAGTPAGVVVVLKGV